MRAFPVRLPSGQRYWTVLDADLQVVEQGRLYPGLDGTGQPDPAATAAACDFLVGELLADDPDRS